MPYEVRVCSRYKMCVSVEMDAYWDGVHFQLITVFYPLNGLEF